MREEAEGTTDWSEGQDGSVVDYSEHVRPPWWVWLLVVAAAVFIGSAYLAALGLLWGALVAILAFTIGVWLVNRTRAMIRVDDRVFQVGRARLPWSAVGRIYALDPEQTLEARGPKADADAFMLYRPSYADTCIIVENTDPDDPHPYWFVSTRYPEQLISAMMSHVTDAPIRKANS